MPHWVELNCTLWKWILSFPEVFMALTATKLVVSFLDCGPTAPVLRFGSYHPALLVVFVSKREALVSVFLPLFHWVVVWSPLWSNLFSVRFLETGFRSDFNKIRMKLSEMGTLQLQNLVRKSRQLRDSIQQDVMKEDCVYVSDYEDRNLLNFFGSVRDPFTEYGRRRIEVVTLD